MGGCLGEAVQVEPRIHLRPAGEPDPASLAPSAALAGLEEWDSLGTIAVIAKLGQRFDRQLAPQEIKSLATVQNILDLMERP